MDNSIRIDHRDQPYVKFRKQIFALGRLVGTFLEQILDNTLHYEGGHGFARMHSRHNQNEWFFENFTCFGTKKRIIALF